MYGFWMVPQTPIVLSNETLYIKFSTWNWYLKSWSTCHSCHPILNYFIWLPKLSPINHHINMNVVMMRRGTHMWQIILWIMNLFIELTPAGLDLALRPSVGQQRIGGLLRVVRACPDLKAIQWISYGRNLLTKLYQDQLCKFMYMSFSILLCH
jgi:hypothetical protein